MQISLNADKAQLLSRVRPSATLDWLLNDITLIFIGSVMSMLVNSFVSLLVLAIVFLKHFFVGDISRCLFNCAAVTAILLFMGVMDYLLLGEGGPITVIRDFAMLAAPLCIGMALGIEKDEAYFRTGLLGIRNLMVFACLVSFVMEVCMRVTFNVSGVVSSVPFQTAPVYMDVFSWRCRSFLGHPIVFAHMLLAAIAISYFLEKSQVKKWVTIALFSVFIFMTRSRSGWLIFAFFLVLSLVLAVHSRKIKHWNYFVLAVPFIVVLAAVLFNSDFTFLIVRRFTELSLDDSYSQRSGAISYMINYWASSPLTWLFGNGDNAAGVAMLESTISIEGFRTVDNGWVSLLYNFGFLGVAGILIIAFQPVMTLRAGAVDKDLQRCILFGSGATFLCEMLFYDSYGWFVPFSLFLLLGGASLTMRSKIAAR